MRMRMRLRPVDGRRRKDSEIDSTSLERFCKRGKVGRRRVCHMPIGLLAHGSPALGMGVFRISQRVAKEK